MLSQLLMTEPLLSEMMDEINKHGIDKLEIMIRFISVFECEEGKEDLEFYMLTSFLEKQLKRKLTPEEDINLTKGILNYLQSEPATKKRIQAMKYLLNTNFLND